jgi:hypothetical protein
LRRAATVDSKWAFFLSFFLSFHFQVVFPGASVNFPVFNGFCNCTTGFAGVGAIFKPAVPRKVGNLAEGGFQSAGRVGNTHFAHIRIVRQPVF